MDGSPWQVGMISKSVAQAVFDKVRKVTVATRSKELVGAFKTSGFSVSADGKTVGNISPSASFEAVYRKLKTSLPVSALTMKRVLSSNGINV